MNFLDIKLFWSYFIFIVKALKYILMSYAAVSIGVFIFILAYFTLNAPPKGEGGPLVQEEVEVAQFCQAPDPETAPTFKAPADNVTKTGSEDDETLGTPLITSDCTGRAARHQFSSNLTTYRLVRKRVPVSKMSKPDKKGRSSENFNDESCHFNSAGKLKINIPDVDSSKYKVFFPQIAGEISLDREIPSRTRGKNSNLLYLIDYGLVFLLHLDENGKFIEVKGGTTEGNPAEFYLADVYQDIESPGRGELPDEALSCDTTRGAKIASGPQVSIPQQNPPLPPDQLQLQYFVFGSAAGSSQVVNGWGIHCKPAVYLYPPEKKLVNVRVYPKGELAFTDPPYDKEKGWTVWAEPGGEMYQESRVKGQEKVQNGYLYYEAKLLDSEIEKPTEGWVVKPSELEDLLNRTLPKLGLNEKEKKDFMDYWLTKLPDSPYYFVGLIEKPQRDYLETLKVTPNPDTSIRFSFFFEALSTPKVVQEPVIETPIRNGFTLVDWGGMIKLHPGTPFTCSQ